MSDQTNEEMLERIKWAEENREKLPYIKQKFPPRLNAWRIPNTAGAWAASEEGFALEEGPEEKFISLAEHEALLESAKREARAEAAKAIESVWQELAPDWRSFGQYLGEQVFAWEKAARASADPEGGEK